MTGPDGSGVSFALVTRGEVEFTVGQLSEEVRPEIIDDPAAVELPLNLVGDEAKLVAGAAKSYLLNLGPQDYVSNHEKVDVARRILYSYRESYNAVA